MFLHYFPSLHQLVKEEKSPWFTVTLPLENVCQILLLSWELVQAIHEALVDGSCLSSSVRSVTLAAIPSA